MTMNIDCKRTSERQGERDRERERDRKKKRIEEERRKKQKGRYAQQLWAVYLSSNFCR